MSRNIVSTQIHLIKCKLTLFFLIFSLSFFQLHADIVHDLIMSLSAKSYKISDFLNPEYNQSQA